MYLFRRSYFILFLFFSPLREADYMGWCGQQGHTLAKVGSQSSRPRAWRLEQHLVDTWLPDLC